MSFAIPIAVAALGKKRLLDIVEALATKPPARLNDTERRILTLAQWAATRLSPDLPVLPGRTGASPSQPAPPPGFVASPLPLGSPALHPHALFGTALFELVEYVDLFSGSAAVSSFMRTGSPDPALSRAGVDPIAFVLELGRIARANAATPDDQRNAERAVLGAMAAVAADVIVNPILSALPEGSPVPARSLPGDLIAAIEAEAQQSLFGSPSRSAWVEMWPTAEQIPLELIAAYAEAIGAYYSDASIISSAGADTPARPAREELLYAYPAFRNLVLGPWGKWETWGYTLLVVGLPMVATLPLLLALPETNRLLTTDPASEREGDATIDIFSLGYTFGLIPPFAASIILHVMLPNEREHTSASFWIAGVRFLAGIFALVAAGENADTGLRILPLLAFIIIDLVLLGFYLAEPRPGVKFIYLINWMLPVFTALMTAIGALLVIGFRELTRVGDEEGSEPTHWGFGFGLGLAIYIGLVMLLCMALAFWLFGAGGLRRVLGRNLPGMPDLALSRSRRLRAPAALFPESKLWFPEGQDASAASAFFPREDRFAQAMKHGHRGPTASHADGFELVPQPGLGDSDFTALGMAGDLAALLCMGAATRLDRGITAPDLTSATDTFREVAQVFRRWNMDERRLNEWRMLVHGDAASEKTGAADGIDPGMTIPPASYTAVHLDAEPTATALGWLPLLRTWLRVARDASGTPEADTASTARSPATPPIFRGGRVEVPTNAELSNALRFLLDLE